MAAIETRNFGNVDCQAAIASLEEALRQNAHCARQVINATKAFAPSGGPEALVLVYADDPFADSFWYGHALRHPRNDGSFVSLLIWSSRHLNAETIPLLFRRLHHWMIIDPHYRPCTIQNIDDAYLECGSFKASVQALARMIIAFDPDLRSGYEGGQSADDPVEMRIVDVYGRPCRYAWLWATHSSRTYATRFKSRNNLELSKTGRLR